MKTTVKNGHVIDPLLGIDELCDIVIEDGKIAEIAKKGQKPRGRKKRAEGVFDDNTFDVMGMHVFPGLIDMHVHLREPGYEYKETIRTGTEAAVRGGFTGVCCMPNTRPVNDNISVTQYIIEKALSEGACEVYPIGAVTKAQGGEELAEMTMMREAGCVAFSDDGKPVADSRIMRRALEYSRGLGVPIISHCEDPQLSLGGVMNEGLVSLTMGLEGIPPQAEEIMVARDVLLAELTGGRLHVAHVSTAGSVEILRAAKRRGRAEITAETCPHYFSITEEAVYGYNTNAKVNPPLRGKRDIEAIREGLADGTIDVIATDHAPHHHDEKLMEFDRAPMGISGLETGLALSLKLVEGGVLTLAGLVEKMACAPSRILGLGKGSISVGKPADLIVVDLSKVHTVRAENFFSKGKNTPFDGWNVKGAVVMTISKGSVRSWE